MCYAVQVVASWKDLAREPGTRMDIHAFYRLFFRWTDDDAIRIPRAVVDAFDRADGGEAAAIAGLIDQRKASDERKLQDEVLGLRKRLADAERSLKPRPTKAAAERIGLAKREMAAAKQRLDDLERTEPKDSDGRVFPGWHAPVLVAEGAQRIIQPMRYQCRPAGEPADHDPRFPDACDARRAHLTDLWDQQFGKTHAVAVISAFHEPVETPDGEKALLQFMPQDGRPLFIACLYSRWSAPGEPDLLSFAAVTDDAPPEIAGAGHDRCVIPLTAAGVDAWLHPERHDREALDRVLDDGRVRPCYEHRLV